jgi:septal ring factor EnvC (AmiA/AmiB activator)
MKMCDVTSLACNDHCLLHLLLSDVCIMTHARHISITQLTNTLQRKLDEVRKEKSVLEKQIEKEKTSRAILQAQLSDLRNDHLHVAEALEEEEEMEEE